MDAQTLMKSEAAGGGMGNHGRPASCALADRRCLLGSPDVASALAQDEAKPPSHGAGHFGDIAGPSQRPVSSVGMVTVLWE